MEPEQAGERVAYDDALLATERGEFLLQGREPSFQLRRVRLGQGGGPDLEPVLDELRRQQELPVLGRSVVLDAAEDQEAGRHGNDDKVRCVRCPMPITHWRYD
jgi:hypothetical protein